MSDVANKRVRTCVGCRKQLGKYELYRIVRNLDKTISFDKKGRLPGRGAYVCSIECLKEAYESHKLQRALKAPVGRDDFERIASEMGEACIEEGRR